MKQSVILLLFFLGSIAASAQDYFPLVPGSTWVYRQTAGVGKESLTLRLGEPAQIDAKTYHRLSGYAAGELLIRRVEDGSFVVIDPVTKLESAFLRLDGRNFPSPVAPCNQIGQVSGKTASYEGPVGYFEGAVTVRYTPGNCADLGLTSETFVPNLGLVRRTQTSFTGERVLELVYAQIGGITYLNEAGVSFSLALTGLPEGKIGARLALTNRTGKPLVLKFSSGNLFDFIVRNEKGEAVYRWSADKIFVQALADIGVNGEQVWQEMLEIGRQPAGIYSVEGFLVNSDGRKFGATASVSLP